MTPESYIFSTQLELLNLTSQKGNFLETTPRMEGDVATSSYIWVKVVNWCVSIQEEKWG